MAERAIWSGIISFGLVSIPVKLYGATSSKDISFNLIHATCGTRIEQKRWCPTHDREVPWEEVARVPVAGQPVKKRVPNRNAWPRARCASRMPEIPRGKPR